MTRYVDKEISEKARQESMKKECLYHNNIVMAVLLCFFIPHNVGMPHFPDCPQSLVEATHRSFLIPPLQPYPLASCLRHLYTIFSPLLQRTRLPPLFPTPQLPPHPGLKFAPPNSTASISSSDHAILPNLFGNSLRSHTSPFPASGSTPPSSWPECPPMPP